MLRGGRESVCISRMETPFAQPRLCDEHWHLLPKFSCVILKPVFEGSDLPASIANGGPTGQSPARGHRLTGWRL